MRFDLLLVNAYLGSERGWPLWVAATLADGMFVIPMVIASTSSLAWREAIRPRRRAEVFRSVAVLWPALSADDAARRPCDPAVLRREYSGATSLYYWLLPGIYAYGMVTILSSHFAGRGFPRAAIVFWVVGFALNVVLNVLFLPGRGAWVAALTSSITYAVLLALHMWLFAREAGGYG